MHLGSDSAGPSLPLELKGNIRKGQCVKNLIGRAPVTIHCLNVAAVRERDSSLLQKNRLLNTFPFKLGYFGASLVSFSLNLYLFFFFLIVLFFGIMDNLGS